MNVRILLVSLALIAGCHTGSSMAQEDATAAVTELRSYDATTGRTAEPLRDGDRITASANGGFALLAHASDGPIGSVRFLIDGVEALVDSEPPYVLAFRPDPNGGWLVALETTVLSTVDVRVDRGAGDAEQFLDASSGAAERYPTGYTYVQSSDLELGRDPSNASQAIGLWFPEVSVPADATVTSARLVFVARGGGEGEFAVTIRGHATTDPVPFEEDPDGFGSQGITSRTTTNAAVVWEFSQADGWSPGEAFASPDVGSVVREIISAAGWSSGSPMAFLISPEGGDGFRRAHSFDGDEGMAPVLRVTFEEDREPASIAVGEHTISAVPYAEPEAGGPAGEARTIQVTVVEELDAAVTEQDDGNGEQEPQATAENGANEGALHDADDRPMSEAPDVGTDTVRRSRYPLEPVQGESMRGTVLLSAYGERTSILSVALEDAPGEPVQAELWVGDCEQRDERLVGLGPFRPGIGSITPVEIAFATLELGTFSVWVATEAENTPLACAEIGSAS